MRIKMVCLEDGIFACGFRKITAYVERLAETETCYVSVGPWLTIKNALTSKTGEAGMLEPEAIDEVAHGLVDADLIGFSSMTGYAQLTHAVIRRVREISRKPFIVWGGIHPIIHPEDAIQADVDAICTGEGEHAFAELYEHLQAGTDFTATKNFWFKREGEIIRNEFRPLMSSAELEALPFAKYGGEELAYRRGQGFTPLRVSDYLATNGLGYTAIWSIGCPFHCTFCGNTKFIANDPKYKKIRHPSAQYIVEEIKSVRRTHPHVSSVRFEDDSFMAIPYPELEAFAELWRAEVGIPFAVFGVIPNYVRRDKYEILTWAGMNRVRMGIQSGSKRILDFYKRPTPPEQILAASKVNSSFAPRYHIPPTYDLIVDNPIETKEDVVANLELLYDLARPYTVNVFALRVIPNTGLEQAMKEAGVDLETISANYGRVAPRWANVLILLLTVWKPPRWLFDRWLRMAEASTTPQRLFPILWLLVRFAYLSKRTINHLRFMDFSALPGYSGYLCWKLGIVAFWRRYLTPRPARPSSRGRSETAPDFVVAVPSSVGAAGA